MMIFWIPWRKPRTHPKCAVGNTQFLLSRLHPQNNNPRIQVSQQYIIYYRGSVWLILDWCLTSLPFAWKTYVHMENICSYGKHMFIWETYECITFFVEQHYLFFPFVTLQRFIPKKISSALNISGFPPPHCGIQRLPLKATLQKGLAAPSALGPQQQ